MQLTLFEPSRLAHRPYCTDDKAAGLAIRGVNQALSRKYIQANCPGLQFRIVLDVDHDIRGTAELRAWADDFMAPEPNWSAITRETGRGHLGYEIEVPVATHDHARAGPIRLAAAVEDALAEKLRADFGYAGLICKNPTHTAWQTVPGRVQAYDLAELADWVDLAKYQGKKALEPRGPLGRNNLLFDRLRMWAYSNLRDYKGKQSQEAWLAAVEAQAQEFNHFHQADLVRKDPLAWSEVKATAKSVGSWTWKNFGEGKAHTDFIATQRHRAGLSAASKRMKTEQSIRDAQAAILAEGELPTLRAVAKRIGKSPGGLSTHYSHLFEQTVH